MAKNSFEENLRALEDILQQLEHGDLPLEAALARFEAGMRLIRLCTEQLDAVDRKVEILLQDEAGNLITRPFLTPNEAKGSDV
ncbi:exodeoxyribonuclease VII small subunit [Desulfobacca acetoxidans]|jgi:exodeoxyribonuclease VII small subunit|uniref:Exodeoxyribonuclease 7 small subunit n=1 Tax=Desulfobacca acetoxidans (strain ATCC 700848 / DSM 11109 / ASRB2) TaxID=880072 RepID=F2NGF5_DESAR|nr:exodeoxyribonuclease VII small subunit [Desulfobacca acetoxidans]AEB08568.1 Exodeoxyribonuclease 7 small subunit [Desulfobacca acetoxidans DSM 11109]HAY21177.1 exodeoxyribonuclease VII small subunit [Desulfobacterales bacterium]